MERSSHPVRATSWRPATKCCSSRTATSNTRSAPRSTAPAYYPRASSSDTEKRQLFAGAPLDQQRNIIAHGAAVEASMHRPHHRIDHVASHAGVSALQIVHKLTDSYLLIDTCHRDKICTTFTVSSTAQFAVPSHRPCRRQPDLQMWAPKAGMTAIAVRTARKFLNSHAFRHERAGAATR
ncbi:Uncharacterised protein [Mycobacteroides abscessus subsp. abscessus]|nr:Uncharacterised protein [Mycobacteroides abscessus subsp. abscessus]